MFVPRWMNTRPSNDRPSRRRSMPYPAWRAARAPTKPGIREATRNGARSAWTQSLATGTGPGGVNGRVMPMKPTWWPSRTIGRTVSKARSGHRKGLGAVSRPPRRFQGMRHPHEADLLPVPIHRADREARAEDVAVLSSQRDFLLELAFLDRFLQETRNEGRHVLRKMEGRDAQLPDDLRR